MGQLARIRMVFPSFKPLPTFPLTLIGWSKPLGIFTYTRKVTSHVLHKPRVLSSAEISRAFYKAQNHSINGIAHKLTLHRRKFFPRSRDSLRDSLIAMQANNNTFIRLVHTLIKFKKIQANTKAKHY